MSIEFRCTNCQKLLRVPDGSEGRSAQCPDCKSMQVVPDQPDVKPLPLSSDPSPWPDTPAAPPQGQSEFSPDAMGGSPFEPAGSPFEPTGSSAQASPFAQNGPEETGNPYQAPAAFDDYQLQNKPSQGGPINPTKVPVTDFLTRSWAIFRNRMGISIGLYLLCMLLFVAFYIGMIVAVFNAPLAIPVVLIPMFLIMPLLMLGLIRGFLKICRGQEASVGDLFRGGHWYLRSLGVGILFMFIAGLPYGAAIAGVQLAESTGNPLFVLLAIVGFLGYLLVCFWFGFAFFALVDQDCGVFRSFGISWRIASINTFRMIWAYILMILCLFGLGIILVIALTVLALIPVVGPFIAIIGVVGFYIAMLLLFYPFMMVFITAAYLMMSGQPIAYQPDSGYASRQP